MPAVAGFGVSAAGAMAIGNTSQQASPGAGCKSIIYSTASSTSVSVPFVSASHDDAHTTNTAACAPNYNNTQINQNKYDR